MGSWWRSPVRTTCVPLDRGGPTVVLECEVRVSTSGARRRRAPRSARSSGNRRARHLTREHVPLADVLAGYVTCSRAGARHDMRDAVPPCEMRYRGEAGTGRRNRPRRRPDRPRRPTRRSRRTQRPRRTRRRLEQTVTAGPRTPTPSTTPRTTPGRRARTPSQQPSGRGGPARADRHHDLHAPRLKPPPNNLHGSAGLPRTPGTAGQESHGATGDTMPKDSPAMGRVGLLGRSEMGTCPDLLQRRSGPGSAARRSAEYQRFFSHASARPGSLQQIRTTGATRVLAEGRPPLGRQP